MKTISLRGMLCALFMFNLAGCGGGGSGSTTTPVNNPPTNTTPDPVTLTVTALDGYLANAHVYIDLNGNYQFDTLEPSLMTGSDGTATFTLTDIADGLLKPVIVEAVKGQTVDMSTGLTVRSSYSMVAPPASTVVSPITTLVQLAIEQGQQADVATAVASLKAQLGITSDASILGDYLGTGQGDPQLYAIARSLVPLLPEDPSTLFTGQLDSETLATLMDRVSAIATTINDAIAAGVTPDSIYVSQDEDGSYHANELTHDEALAFLQDVQNWSDVVSFDFIHAAQDFGHMLQAAAQVSEADTSALLTMLAQYSKGGLLALQAGVHRQFDAGLFISGSTGTVTTTIDSQTQVESVLIDAQLDGRSVVATLTLSSNQTLSASLTANLDSDTVNIMVLDGSELSLNAQTYVPKSMGLNATIDTKTGDEQVSPVHFAGNIAVQTAELVKSDGETTVIFPTLISLSGLFEVGGSDSFDAGLAIGMSPALEDDQLVLEQASVQLKLDAAFSGLPNAYMVLDVKYAEQLDELALLLVYGDRMIKVVLGDNDNGGDLVITNAMGMTLTLDLALAQNATDRGTLVMGIHPVASIDKVDGHYVVTFNDGTTITLF